MKMILLTVIVVLEFVLATLPYRPYKKFKLANKLEITSMCISAIFKLLFLYAIIAPIYIVLLKIRLKMPIDEIIHDIFLGWKVVLKFHAIASITLCFMCVLSKCIEFSVTLLPTQGTNKKPDISSSILFFFFCFFTSLYVYVGRFFPGMDIDQLFFTLFAPAVGMSSEIWRASIIMLLVIPAVLSIANFILTKLNLKITFLFAINISRLFPFKVERKLIFSCGVVVFALTVLFARFPIIEFIKREIAPVSNFYETYYIDPSKVEFKFPEKKKNLIFIYLESLEVEAAKGILPGEDIIPHLSSLAKENLSFSHSSGLGGPLQVPGTTNSISSCCNTHVGLPLVMSVDNRFGKYARGLFAGAYGLGNILSNEGYETSYLIGSLGSSFGMNSLLETHGFPLKSLEYWKKIKKVPEDYFVWWGVEDKKLVEYAKEELLSLSKQNKPFAFSVFFEDTHFHKGYVCEECGQKYMKSIHNVYECTSRRMGMFLEWMRKQDFYENSLIVILGDHLYMGDDLYGDSAKNNLFSNHNRHAYNVFINTDKDYSRFAKNRDYCTFDYFPTIIDCLGIEYKEPGLGIGRSLVREGKTLLETLGEEKLSAEMVKKNTLYRKLLVSQ